MASSFTNAFTALPTTPWPADVSYQKIILTGDITLTFPSSFGTSPNVVARSMDVDSDNATNGLYLSSADQVSIGFDFIISNVGSFNFSLYNSNSDLIVLSEPNSSYIVQLTAKTTSAGTWETIQLGYVTAAPNASALAGYGLTPLNGKLNTNSMITRLNSSYILDPSDRATLFVWEGGNGTIKLPDPSAVNVRNGFYVSVNNATLAGGTVTITPFNAELIDNLADFPLNPAETATFQTDGTNWFSLGYGTADFFTYEVLDLDISLFSGGTLVLTSQEAAKTIQEFRGTLTAEVQIVYPTTPSVNEISNFTTGGFNINLTTTNETPIPVRASEKVICVFNGEIMYQTPSIDSSDILFEDGTALLPSITFASNITDGIYHSAAGQVDFTCAASQVAQMSSIGLQVIPGTPGNPSYSFIGFTNLGLWKAGSDAMTVQATDTWLQMGVNSLITSFDAGVTNTVTTTSTGIKTIDGTAAAPSYAYIGDTATGVYRVSDNNLGLAAGGAQIVNINPAGIQTIPGSTNNAAYGFIGRAATVGMYSTGDGLLDFQASTFTATMAAAGLSFTYDSGGTTVQTIQAGGFFNVAGVAGSPSYSFATQPAVGAFAPDIDTYATQTTSSVTVLTNNYWELSVAAGGYNFRIDATSVNASGKSYEQDGINIFSLMRAYS